MKVSLALESKVVLAVFICTVYLSLAGLAKHVFWCDEANVGVTARTMVQTGYISAWDGRNLLAVDEGRGLNEKLQSWNSPLEYVPAALGFKLFGISTWAGRIFFVLIGLAALALFYLLLRLDFPSWHNFRIYAFCSMALSYSFLLNIRQCRYYALCIFGVVALYYCYKKFLTTRSWWYGAGCTAAALIFFFSNYLLAAVTFCTLIVIHIVFYRKSFTKSQWLIVGVAGVLFAGIVIPFGIYERIWQRPYEVAHTENTLVQRGLFFLWNLRELDGIAYLPGLLMLPFAGFLIYYRKRDIIPSRIFEYVCFVLVYVFFLALLTHQKFKPNYQFADIRYLVTLIPFAACCIGCFCALIARALGPVAASAVCFVALSTNVFCINISAPQFRLLLPAYIGEVHANYNSTLDVVIKYLKENVSKDETVYCEPEHNLSVFNFYLGEHAYIGGTLRRSTPLAPEAIARCNRPLYIDEYFPDWIILFSMMQNQVDILNYFSRDTTHRYRPWQGLNVFFKDQTRPELPWHSFGPFTQFDPDRFAVYVFRQQAPRF